MSKNVITGAIVAAVFLVVLIALGALKSCTTPRVDPELGKAMHQATASKAAETTAVTEKAAPDLKERVQAPIRKRTEKARHYVAKIEAAPPPPAGAVSVPDDDAYRSLCIKGGLYQGDPERGRECRKLKG